MFNGTNLEHYLTKNWEIIADVSRPWDWDTREGRPMRLVAANLQPTKLDGFIATPSIRKFVCEARRPLVSGRNAARASHPFNHSTFT